MDRRYYCMCSQSCYSYTAGVTSINYGIWLLMDLFPCSLISVNWGLQYHVALAVQVTWSYSYFAAMVGWISPSICNALQEFQQPFSGMQLPLGRANPSFTSEHTKMSSCWGIPPPCTWSPSSCLPCKGACCVFCKHACINAPLVTLRSGFCGARGVEFSLFASPPQALCALILFS